MCFKKLHAIWGCLALMVFAIGVPYPAFAEQSEADIALQEAADIRKNVEVMMERGKQYNIQIADMIKQRDEIQQIIDNSHEETEQLITRYEKLSNALQRINFDKDLTLSQWRELSQQARERMDIITKKQARILQRLKIKTDELNEIERDLEKTVQYAKQLGEQTKMAFKQWEEAEAKARTVLNETATAAGTP